MTGATTLEEAGDVLGITFPEEFETLNGFLISLLGRIPNEGESFTSDYENYRFHILNVESKMIQQVDVESLPQPAENSNDTNLESTDEK